MATIFFALRLISALIRFKWSQCRLCKSDLSCLLAAFDSCRKLIFLSSYPKCANLRMALNWLWTCCPASEMGCVGWCASLTADNTSAESCILESSSVRIFSAWQSLYYRSSAFLDMVPPVFAPTGVAIRDSVTQTLVVTSTAPQ